MFAMSSGLLDPTPGNVPLNYAPSNAGPRCHGNVMVLPQIRRIDEERDRQFAGYEG
jgi:hypothetical protein